MNEFVPGKTGRPKTLLPFIRRFSVRLSAGEYITVNDRALYEGVSMAALVRLAIREYLSRRGIHPNEPNK
jgi:uncharacterized protein YbbC (DUF1343 family)